MYYLECVAQFAWSAPWRRVPDHAPEYLEHGEFTQVFIKTYYDGNSINNRKYVSYKLYHKQTMTNMYHTSYTINKL